MESWKTNSTASTRERVLRASSPDQESGENAPGRNHHLKRSSGYVQGAGGLEEQENIRQPHRVGEAEQPSWREVPIVGIHLNKPYYVADPHVFYGSESCILFPWIRILHLLLLIRILNFIAVDPDPEFYFCGSYTESLFISINSMILFPIL